MNKRTLRSFLAVLLAGSVLWLGCGQGEDGDRPATYPVTGTVTLQGEAVEGATVNFQLADGSGSAVGMTDAGGDYSLTTFKSGDGAVPGEYKIKITQYKGEEITGASNDSGELGDDYAPPGEGGEEESAEPENLLPAVYADPSTSRLTATVRESGENKFDFKLED